MQHSRKSDRRLTKGTFTRKGQPIEEIGPMSKVRQVVGQENSFIAKLPKKYTLDNIRM
jgi:hypothetical protein